MQAAAGTSRLWTEWLAFLIFVDLFVGEKVDRQMVNDHANIIADKSIKILKKHLDFPYISLKNI